ncbi:MAG: hypothetical protein FRX49_07533 [Trebouxia sp. A1-2]|nr:MAG: hypothetical protein FRX49_07533 [Trebouxia sp. A1-2]
MRDHLAYPMTAGRHAFQALDPNCLMKWDICLASSNRHRSGRPRPALGVPTTRALPWCDLTGVADGDQGGVDHGPSGHIEWTGNGLLQGLLQMLLIC